MKNSSSKKILVAIDGSEYSSEAVRYASATLNPQTTQVVLFHALKKIDDAFWNIGMKKGVLERMIDIKAWEAAQDEAIKKIMDKSRQVFIDKGFIEDAVRENIHQCEQGVARDIIKESKGGYDAVFLGRKGVSKLKDLVIGGTALKLIEKTTHIPVCVVGRGVTPGRIIVAIDASEGAMKAVDYVGSMFGNMDAEITLLHVLSDITGFEPRYGMTYPGPISTEPERWLEEEQQEINRVFEKVKKQLVSAGLDAAQVKTKIIKDVGSRASVVVQEARQAGYGSIVIGRRGISKVEQFFMGSMSNKVVHLGKGMAVWVVS
jgi:nucleotide-binding universal stress UspA family protein